MSRRESTSEHRRIIPLKYKIMSACLIALTSKAGVTDELAYAAYDTAGDVVAAIGTVTGYEDSASPQSADPEQGIVEPGPTPPAPALSPPPVGSETIPSECLGGTYDGWHFNPNADAIIDTINYSVGEKDFLKQAIRGVCESKRAGSLDNPVISFAQASLESANGQDTLSPYYNYFGHKAGNTDKSVSVWTKEDYGDGLVRVKQDFSVYDTPMGSFYEHGEMLGRLPWYADAIACRTDNEAYAKGLQHEIDPTTCEIVREKGSEGVLSYATANHYITSLFDRAGYIKAEELIYRP